MSTTSCLQICVICCLRICTRNLLFADFRLLFGGFMLYCPPPSPGEADCSSALTRYMELDLKLSRRQTLLSRNIYSKQLQWNYMGKRTRLSSNISFGDRSEMSLQPRSRQLYIYAQILLTWSMDPPLRWATDPSCPGSHTVDPTSVRAAVNFFECWKNYILYERHISCFKALYSTQSFLHSKKFHHSY